MNGVSGSNTNDCKSLTTACKTIGHAISLASSRDSIMVASATYFENLTISLSLKIIGATARITIIDGGGVGRVIAVNNTSGNVMLSKLTIRNGRSYFGGGVFNCGRLTINACTISGNIVTGGGSAGLGSGVGNAGTVMISNSTDGVALAQVGFCKASRSLLRNQDSRVPSRVSRNKCEDRFKGH